MATIETLRTSVRVNSKFTTDKVSDDDLDTYIRAAVLEHKPSISGDLAFLDDKDSEPIMILAWERACLALASQIAPEVNLNITRMASTAMGQDRTTPVTKLLALAASLRNRYNQLTGALGISSSGGISQSHSYRKNDLTGAYTNTSVPLITASVLQAADPSSNQVVLTWSESLDENFYEYFLYSSLTNPIRDGYSANSSGIPELSASASKLFQTTNRFKNAVLVEDLLPATTYYYMLITKSRNNRYVYSNQVTVNNP